MARRSLAPPGQRLNATFKACVKEKWCSFAARQVKLRQQFLSRRVKGYTKQINLPKNRGDFHGGLQNTPATVF
jgi:hypothetical protein